MPRRCPQPIENIGCGGRIGTFDLWVMSVTGIGYVVHNKARVALERALRNPRKPVMGVERESILTFGFSPQGMGVGSRNKPLNENEESPETMTELPAPDSYGQLLADLKRRIRAAQLRIKGGAIIDHEAPLERRLWRSKK
jgi:hypothetical protein